MAKNKFDRNNKNNTKGQETMGAKIEDTAVDTAVGTEEEMVPVGEEQVESTSNTIDDSEKLDAVDSEFKVANPDDVKDEETEPVVKVGDEPLLSDEKISELVDAENEIGATLEQTPPPVDTDAEIKTQLEDSTYPPVAVAEPDTDLNPANIDTTTLVFNKKSINTLIASYNQVDIILDENTSILNTEENQRARHLIKTLNTLNPAAGDKIETKILGYLALYVEPTDAPKNPGMLMQLIAKEVNEAKTIADLDMAMYILTRVFTNVASFNIRSFLKIGNDYSAEFKVNALQMVEALSQLATADDRKKKIGATISLQKTFKTSTSFLNANGSKLMIEYFSK